MKSPITKQEASKLAQTIRDDKTGSNMQSILWAVNYHLPLYLWGVETADQVLNALLIAATAGVEPNIVTMIGLDRLIKIGSPLIETQLGYSSGGMINTVEDTNTSIL